MSRKGTHTCDIVVDYHRCPECGYINENREKFRYQLGEYLKDVVCCRCGCEFVLKRERKPKFGPIWDYD